MLPLSPRLCGLCWLLVLPSSLLVANSIVSQGIPKDGGAGGAAVLAPPPPAVRVLSRARDPFLLLMCPFQRRAASSSLMSFIYWRLSSSPLVELTFTGTTLQHVNLSGHASPVTACNRLPSPNPSAYRKGSRLTAPLQPLSPSITSRSIQGESRIGRLHRVKIRAQEGLLVSLACERR